MNWYTAEEAAEKLGVSYSRVRQIAKDANGEIGRKFGRAWMFSDEDIERMRNRRREVGRPSAKETPQDES